MINKRQYENLAYMLKVIAHPLKLMIIELLADGELSVGQIQENLKLKQAVTSQYLNELKGQGILASRRKGKNVYYHLENREALKIIACLKRCYAKK